MDLQELATLPARMKALEEEVKLLRAAKVEQLEKNPPKFIPRKEVKQMLGVKSDVTILSYERKKILIPHRVGRFVFYKAQEVNNIMKSFERE